MVFRDYEYRRPDTDAVVASYGELAQKVAAAADYAAVRECVERHEKLFGAFYTQRTLAEIRHTVDTRDKFYDDENKFFADESPRVEQAQSVFALALLASPFLPQLKKDYPAVVFDKLAMKTKTISAAVVPLLGREAQLQLDYQRLQASAQLDFMGKKLTIAQLGIYKTDPDTAVRRAAFAAEGSFYMQHKDEFDGIYADMVTLRTEIAKELGFDSFKKLGYLRMQRLDYDEKMIDTFRANVRKYLVPLIVELKKQQAQRIGADHIKYQDDAVLFKQGNPRPVGNYDDTYAAGVALYRKMNAETREFIDFMDSSELFDLIATPGKAAGGYCTYLPDYRAPFIFSNFNGTAGDVEVFTHEGGHAFAAFTAAKQCNMLEAMETSMENAEVHSMSMEFMAWPELESFYGERTADAKLAHLLSALYFIPYGCIVDEYQHIVYAHPEYTPEQRNEAWMGLEKQYRPYIDFDNIPFYGDGRGWQRQLHIYLDPFYYIDYCLAQTVALGVFARIQNNGFDDAWSHYYEFVKLAGTDAFLANIKKSGLDDPFDENSIKLICDTVRGYLAKNS